MFSIRGKLMSTNNRKPYTLIVDAGEHAEHVSSLLKRALIQGYKARAVHVYDGGQVRAVYNMKQIADPGEFREIARKRLKREFPDVDFCEGISVIRPR